MMCGSGSLHGLRDTSQARDGVNLTSMCTPAVLILRLYMACKGRGGLVVYIASLHAGQSVFLAAKSYILLLKSRTCGHASRVRRGGGWWVYSPVCRMCKAACEVPRSRDSSLSRTSALPGGSTCPARAAADRTH